MGNLPSKADPNAPQPDGTSVVSNPTAPSRLPSRLSLRRNTSLHELEGDPNVTRFYELDGTSQVPEMSANPRSTNRLLVSATYLQAADSRSSRLGAAELSVQPGAANKRLQGSSATARQSPRISTTTRWREVNSVEDNYSQLVSPVDSASPTLVAPRVPQAKKDPVRNAQLSRSITGISQLLREMYSLDLKIYGSSNADDQTERNKMIKEADALFNKIKATLDGWEAQDDWTDDEREVIRKLRRLAVKHSPKRT